MRGLLENKKGEFESALLAVIMIFIIGIILFFFNHVNDKLYTELDEYFNSTSDYNDSTARDTLTKIHTVENSVWDYAFLAVFIGVIIQLVILSFATRINIAFFWIFVIMGIVVLVVGVILSSIWQEMAEKPEFVDTLARFPITHTILGSYFPVIIVAILVIMLLVLFGKPPKEEIG